MTTGATQYCGPCQKWVAISSTTTVTNFREVGGKLEPFQQRIHIFTCGHVQIVEEKP